MALPHLHFTSLSPPELCGDIVESYRLAAEHLGYPTSYADSACQVGAINVLFFFWNVPWESIAPYHPDCIVVNFEPMVPGTHAWGERYLDVLKRAYVWEYSRSNYQRYRELGYRNADHVGLGWEPAAAEIVPVEVIRSDAAQDIDVLFFGSLTNRRIDILEALMKLGLRVEVNRGSNWSLEQRNAYLSRAKVVLNLHNWDNSRVVEVPRLSILWRHRKAVVCELYPDSEIDAPLRAAVVGARYDKLVDTVVDLLADAPRRFRLERDGLAIYAAHTGAPRVGPALERFLAWRAQQISAEPPDVADAAVAATSPAQPVSLQTPPVQIPHSVTVCLMVGASTHDLAQCLTAWHSQRNVAIDLVLVAAGADAQLLEAIVVDAKAAGLTRVQAIELPPRCDRATAGNLALRHCTGDYLVLCDTLDMPTADRLTRQAALLARCAEVDIVGCWSGPEAAPVQFAERHHDIVTELLSARPLTLGACLIRRDFLVRTRVRLDAEFAPYAGLHFLCKCAAAGARFAVLPLALNRRTAPGFANDDDEWPVQLASREREPLWRHLFPQATQHDLAQMALLHALDWAPSLAFAQQLLAVLAKACASLGHPPSSLDREAIVRAVRQEALRLLQVFFDAGLADADWLETQFADRDIATFLTPARSQLPCRIFASRTTPQPDPIT